MLRLALTDTLVYVADAEITAPAAVSLVAVAKLAKRRRNAMAVSMTCSTNFG